MRATALLVSLSLAFLLMPLPSNSQEQDYSPYHIKVQFAGDIGFLSVGAGRSFLREKLETDLFLGYLPEKIGGDRIVTTALKVTYAPLRSMEVKSLEWQPLRTGIQLSYTFGKDYYTWEHKHKYSAYSKGYYGFPTALHLYFFLGGQVDFNRVEKLSRFGAYYEFGSNAEYLLSYAQNRSYLGPGKIFNLALGVRMKL